MSSPGAARAAPSAHGTSSATSLQSRHREEGGYSPLTFSCDIRHCLTRQLCPSSATQWSSVRWQHCFWTHCSQGHLLGSEATLCQQIQFPSWTARAAPSKPAPPRELMMKNKMKPNSLLCSHIHVLHIQKWSVSVLMGIRQQVRLSSCEKSNL